MRLAARLAALLLAHGQTTEGTRLAVARASAALGRPWRLQVRWDQVALVAPDGTVGAVHEVEPTGVDIRRVVAAEAVVDGLCAGRLPLGASAFAAVVSLVPGFYLFQAASALTVLSGTGPTAEAVMGLLAPAATAGLILLALTVGLIAPKLVVDAVVARSGRS